MFGLDPLYTPARQVTGTEVAVFDTNKGIIKVQLDGKGAPIHVANFCELTVKLNLNDSLVGIKDSYLSTSNLALWCIQWIKSKHNSSKLLYY